MMGEERKAEILQRLVGVDLIDLAEVLAEEASRRADKLAESAERARTSTLPQRRARACDILYSSVALRALSSHVATAVHVASGLDRR
jgi:O-methyltransferase involved in polyketide biosynthesis